MPTQLQARIAVVPGVDDHEEVIQEILRIGDRKEHINWKERTTTVTRVVLYSRANIRCTRHKIRVRIRPSTKPED